MKYLVLLAGDESVEAGMSPADVRAEMADHDAFSQAVSERGTILAGEALGESTTATTLRHRDGLPDGEVMLTDGPYAETAEQMPVLPDVVSGGYRARIKAHVEELRQCAAANRVDYELMTTDRPLDFALFSFLSRRAGK